MLKPTDVFQPPDEETLRKMVLDLGEDPQRLEKQIELFKEWLKCENYLPKNVDDRLILNIIRHCKCDLEKAKKKFVNYLLLREKFSRYYNNKDICQYFDEIELHRQFILSTKLTPEGYRLAGTRVSKDINKFDFMKTFHFFLLFVDFVLHEDVCGGYVGIYDFKHLSAQHLGKMNFKYVVEALDIAYNVGAFRIKALHVVNPPKIPDTIVALLRKVIPQKLLDRVHVHKDVSTLKNHFPAYVIPKDYGGDGMACDEACDNIKSFFVENIDWQRKLKDLKLRGPIPNRKKEIYSFEDCEMGGSFRKLAID